MRMEDIVAGMRVRAMVDYRPVRAGDEGVVVIPNGFGSVGVRWDNFHQNKHNLDGHCDTGHGWRFNPKRLEEVFEDVDVLIADEELIAVLEVGYV